MLNEKLDEGSELIHEETVSKGGLCKKYDISIEKLDFDYISKCKDIKELERIVKILRSGEEGFFPDLQKHAEKHLEKLAPKSRYLRIEEPIVRRESLEPEEKSLVDTDMKQWENDMSLKEEELMDWNKNYPSLDTGSGDHIPPVRKPLLKKVDNKKQHESASKKQKKPMISDYASWDKYDADAELLKMDTEEDSKKLRQEREMKKQKAAAEAELKKEEHSRLNDIIKMAETMPEAEKSFHALREKDRGNEYYKTCNYDDAISYYTASIAICPNAIAYNNRAASYLKQGKYDFALSDVNKCLELDPENTKGLYRRGLCLQHKNKFDEALHDMQAVLRKEPHNLLVQHVAKELRQQCRSVPRSVRLLVEEDVDKVVEMTETEAQGVKDGIEVNEWGLARIMCSCYGRPQFIRGFTPSTSDVANHLIYNSEREKKKKSVKSCDKERPIEYSLPGTMSGTICSDPMEWNGNVIEPLEVDRLVCGHDADNLDPDELIPKKIKIIESVKASSDLNSNRPVNKEREKPNKCTVKDMRGQKYVQGQKESEMMEQFGNIKIEEPPLMSTTLNPVECLNENRNRTTNSVKQKSNNNRINNERNNHRVERAVVNYEFHVPSEKQPICIASKYTQKVGSAKNVNAQKDYDEFRNINNINSNVSNQALIDDKNDELTPFQFFHLWVAIKDSNLLEEYASILRRISPSKLKTTLGNKLDDKMLLVILETLRTQFNLTDPDEADLVKQYLVSLSQVDRFSINIKFISSDIKQLTCGLIDKVGGEDTNELKKSYLE